MGDLLTSRYYSCWFPCRESTAASDDLQDRADSSLAKFTEVYALLTQPVQGKVGAGIKDKSLAD
ncbi:MAG: hypothetical protein ACREQP_16200 [Candidatus Binatia bacterium]